MSASRTRPSATAVTGVYEDLGSSTNSRRNAALPSLRLRAKRGAHQTLDGGHGIKIMNPQPGVPVVNSIVLQLTENRGMLVVPIVNPIRLTTEAESRNPSVL
jgi:hypothetical protein